MNPFVLSDIHQQALDRSAYLPNGELVWWENKLDHFAYLYRCGILTHDDYEAVGGDPGNVPTMEELEARAEELDGNLDQRKCVYCDQILRPTGEAEISYCLNCGAAG